MASFLKRSSVIGRAKVRIVPARIFYFFCAEVEYGEASVCPQSSVQSECEVARIVRGAVHGVRKAAGTPTESEVIEPGNDYDYHRNYFCSRKQYL